MLKNIAALLFLSLLPALAEPPAHPALWHVQGREGEVYLFGSIHVMPPDAQWHTPALDKAIARADVFVFELPTDAATMARMQALVAAHGYLPPGESLRAKLDAAGQADLDAALAAVKLPLMAVDRDRPWLASLQMEFAELSHSGYAADSGVDAMVLKLADAAHKPKRYFETIDQQFALLAPGDETLEMAEFRSDLKDLAKGDADFGEMITAWRAGDMHAMAEVMNSALEEFPQARKALLDDRNQRWVPQIRAMLAEKHVFFITVGAGHLAGPGSVPDLLRKAGYKVEGP